MLDEVRSVFNELKLNYQEFLSSLRYESISEKQRRKYNRRRVEEMEDDEGWENNITKNFSFEEELAIQNAGLLCFQRMLDNLRKLEHLNHEISIKHVQNNPALKPQLLEDSLDYLAYVDKQLPTIHNSREEFRDHK